MGLLEALSKLLGSGEKRQPHRRQHHRKTHPIVCGAVRFNEGRYSDDNEGESDERVFYKVKSGQVKKKIIIKHVKIPNTNYNFSLVELRPTTESAFVVIIKEHIRSGHNMAVQTAILKKLLHRKVVKLDI